VLLIPRRNKRRRVDPLKKEVSVNEGGEGVVLRPKKRKKDAASGGETKPTLMGESNLGGLPEYCLGGGGLMFRFGKRGQEKG